MSKYEEIAYGDSFNKSKEIIKILYPNGISIENYENFLTIIRIIDKLFRVANKPDAFGEDPWEDIARYGLLASAKLKQDTIPDFLNPLPKEADLLHCEKCLKSNFHIWRDPHWKGRRWCQCQNCKTMYNASYEKINYAKQTIQSFYKKKCIRNNCNNQIFMIKKNKHSICLKCNLVNTLL